MNVLVVDDQVNVVSSIKSGIDWSALGIGNVYTALDAFEAKEHILAYDIDILLTDIEMPVESGLSLVRWSREKNYDFECIFLTSQADFFYAQEALQLGSYDYLLQPARYEDIVAAVQKAILRIQEQQKNKAFLDFGKAAISQRDSFIKSILDDFLSGENSDSNEVLSTLNAMNIPLNRESNVYLLRIQILKWHSEPLGFMEWSEQSAELLQNIFSFNQYNVLSYCPDTTSLVALIYNEDNTPNIDVDIYETRLKMLYNQLLHYLGCYCAVYAAPSEKFKNLLEAARAVSQEERDNILQKEGVYLYKQHPSSSTITHCDAHQLKRFSLYLIHHQALKAEQEALSYLQNLKNQNLLNHDTLLAFRWDYHQASSEAARELGLFERYLHFCEEQFSTSESKPLTLNTVSSYIKQITEFFDTALVEDQTSENTFMKIKDYIQNNIDKPLLCSDVAKAVYLNPDYVNRIVQQKKGMSLKEYITLSKMKTAKNMLLVTTLSVSMIAAKVGYNNFSHFSKVYKKVMDKTPSAERKSETV